jgi:superfamily II DNA or RNA helicase
MTPRPYQLEIARQLDLGWSEASKQLVVSTMGSGKTICFAQQALKFCEAGERTLILVDQDELVKQAVQKIEATTGLKCDVEKAERYASKSSMVVVASVQSMCRRLADWPQDHFGLVIADEADKSLAATWQRCLKHFDGRAKVAGFTATPNRGDSRSLGEYYTRIAFEAYFFDFIGNGKWAFDVVDGQRVQKNWVAPIAVQMLPIKIDLSGFGADRDFTDSEADAIITPHLLEIAKAIQHYAAFRRTLLFLPMISTCQRFAEVARGIGLAAEWVSGEDRESDKKLQRFRNWEFDVLANSMLLSRGVDIPEIDALMVGRVTKSVSLYQQFVGRGTRICPGKDNLLLLDPLYVADKRMVCRPATLIAGDAVEADNITEELSGSAFQPEMIESGPLDLMDAALAARERALIREMEKKKEEKAKLFSLSEIASHYEVPAVDVSQPEAARPVTDKQMEWLQKIRVAPDGKFFIFGGPASSKPLDISEITSEAQASSVLALAFNKKNQGVLLASIGQRMKMRQMGCANWETATAADARRFFAGLNSRKKQEAIL